MAVSCLDIARGRPGSGWGHKRLMGLGPRASPAQGEGWQCRSRGGSEPSGHRPSCQGRAALPKLPGLQEAPGPGQREPPPLYPAPFSLTLGRPGTRAPGPTRWPSLRREHRPGPSVPGGGGRGAAPDTRWHTSGPHPSQATPLQAPMGGQERAVGSLRAPVGLTPQQPLKPCPGLLACPCPCPGLALQGRRVPRAGCLRHRGRPIPGARTAHNTVTPHPRACSPTHWAGVEGGRGDPSQG